jgi:hypothetical protein
MAEEEYQLPPLEDEKPSAHTTAPPAEEEYHLPKINRFGESTDSYGEMPWSEVGKMAYGNFAESAKNNLMAIPQAVLHPVDTAGAVGDLGRGAFSKAKGLFVNQDPDKKAEDEKLLDAVIEPYTSVAGFKKALANDPVSILSTAATPLTGGSSLGLNAASKLGKVASVGTHAVKALADPASAALGVTGKVLSKAPSTINHIASGAAGLPEEVTSKAFDLYSSPKSPVTDAHKQVFNDYAEGHGNPVDMSRAASAALEKIKNDAHTEWQNSKEWLTGRAKHPVDEQFIIDKLDEAEKNIGDRSLMYNREKPAYDAVDQLRQELTDRLMNKQHGLSVPEVDAWKRSLYNESKGLNGNHKAVVDAAHAGVREALSAQVPEYMRLMEGYQYLLDDLQNLQKTLGGGNRVSANREMAMLMRQFGNEQGRDLIGRLAQHSPELPYMIAGSLASSLSPHGRSSILSKGVDLGAIIAGMHGITNEKSFIPALIGGTVAGGIHAAQSPSAVVGAAKLAGSVAKPFKIGAKYVSENTPDAVKSGAKKIVGAGKKVASPAATNLKRGRFEVNYNGTEENRGGRIGRKAGGRIVRALTAEQLISGLERARNRQKKKTEPILNKTDEAVVRALHIANQHI